MKIYTTIHMGFLKGIMRIFVFSFMIEPKDFFDCDESPVQAVKKVCA